MTASLPLALALVELFGLSVQPVGQGGHLLLEPETVIAGDVLGQARGSAMVSWCRAVRPRPDLRSRCFLARLDDGGTAPRSAVPAFHELRHCGVARLRLSRSGTGIVGVTSCSERAGIWAWAEHYDAGGDQRLGPLPLVPLPGRTQEAPVPVPGPDGGSWVVWTEADESHRGEATVRAIRLDRRGEPVGDALDLSAPAAAIMSTVGTNFAAGGLPGGGLAVAWSEPREEEVGARLGTFDAGGRPTAAPVDFESGAMPLFEPLRLATDGSGRITIAWWRKRVPGSGDVNLYAASFSGGGETLVAATPVVPRPLGPRDRPPIAAVASLDGRIVVAWTDAHPETGEPRIGVRRWSPELGPEGLVTWVEGAVTDRWPFLELVPGDVPGTLTLYWKETVDDPELGLIAVLRWQELAVPT